MPIQRGSPVVAAGFGSRSSIFSRTSMEDGHTRTITAWQGSRGLSEGGVVGALLDPIIAATSTTAWQGSRGLGPQ